MVLTTESSLLPGYLASLRREFTGLPTHMSEESGLGDFLHPTERDQTCSYRMGTDQGMIYTSKAAKAAVQINAVEWGKWRRVLWGKSRGMEAQES